MNASGVAAVKKKAERKLYGGVKMSRRYVNLAVLPFAAMLFTAGNTLAHCDGMNGGKKHCGVRTVAPAPEATPVHEAARLQADLLRAGIQPFAWVIN